MTFVSHAQNYEDLVLWRALKDVEQGTYIDLGAAWPNFHSVTKAFYDRGWRGINIEPNPTLLAELNRARIRDQNVGVAIGDTEGDVTLNVMSNAGLSTISKEIAAGHIDLGFEKQEVVMPMTTLKKLCEAHVEPDTPIHFLKVDVEGHEAAALSSNDWTRFRPWIVLVEAMEPMSQVTNHHEWEHFVTDADYTLVYCDGLNRFYVANEHHEALAPAFLYPPNIFDDYMSVDQQKAMQEAQALRAQLEALGVSRNQVEKNLSAENAYLSSRGVVDALICQSDGTPKRWARSAFFRTSGKIRPPFQRVVLKRNGKPRHVFRRWMRSDAYLALPHAYVRQK